MCPWPVSYTHLDVYKRQAVHHSRRAAGYRIVPSQIYSIKSVLQDEAHAALREPLPALRRCRHNAEISGIIPVSYTHLPFSYVTAIFILFRLSRLPFRRRFHTIMRPVYSYFWHMSIIGFPIFFAELLLSLPHMPFRLTRLCHLVPQAWASGFCGAGFGCILFLQTTLKIGCF